MVPAKNSTMSPEAVLRPDGSRAAHAPSQGDRGADRDPCMDSSWGDLSAELCATHIRYPLEEAHSNSSSWCDNNGRCRSEVGETIRAHRCSCGGSTAKPVVIDQPCPASEGQAALDGGTAAAWEYAVSALSALVDASIATGQPPPTSAIGSVCRLATHLGCRFPSRCFLQIQSQQVFPLLELPDGVIAHILSRIGSVGARHGPGAPGGRGPGDYRLGSCLP
jgi:hypothetical protein